jgi:hypothetical protein
MSLYTPLLGELQLLDKMLKKALSTDENYILKLYQNNYTPDGNAAPGSFTEANFTNYAAVTMTRALWNSSTIVSGVAQTSYGSAPLSWTCGASGNTIYGYYVVGATSAVVLWAELFATSRVLANQDVLNLTPQFTLTHS